MSITALPQYPLKTIWFSLTGENMTDENIIEVELLFITIRNLSTGQNENEKKKKKKLN